jgi:hypothetical protein
MHGGIDNRRAYRTVTDGGAALASRRNDCGKATTIRALLGLLLM